MTATTLGALALWVTAVRFSPARLLAALAASAALVAFAAFAVFVPAFERAQPTERLLADLERELRARPDARLVFCEDPLRVERMLLFRLRVASVERCDLWAPASSRLPFLVLLRERQRAPLMEIPSVRFAGWYNFMPAEAFTLDGLLGGVEPDRLALLANFETSDAESLVRARREWRRRVRDRESAGPQAEGVVPVP
jgi:hypothetical protein